MVLTKGVKGVVVERHCGQEALLSSERIKHLLHVICMYSEKYRFVLQASLNEIFLYLTFELKHALIALPAIKDIFK